ncbi:MAG: CPBP family intramembrane metalloprotease [Clostridia bacterium]|nr:CPBP family intramembrane metalloprotease [Clostridia bacterium]
MFNFATSPLLARHTPGERVFRLLFDFIVVWAIAIFSSFLVGFVPGVAATVILGVNGFLSLFDAALSSGMSGGAGTVDSTAVAQLTEQIAQSDGYRIAELFGEAWIVAVALFVCLAVQRRSLSTMGIERKDAAKRYGIGLLFGVVLCSGTILISCLTRASTFNGYSGSVRYLFLVFLFVGYVIQGAAEEILIHGLFMTSLARKMRWLPSVLVSALIFSLLHLGNSGVTLLSLFNVFLFGVFLGLFVLRTGSVFGAAALHTAWNFTEGYLFGCSVSGITSSAGVFSVTADATRSMTNGGAFGPEGGLAATMILMLALIAVLFFPSFRKKTDPAD